MDPFGFPHLCDSRERAFDVVPSVFNRKYKAKDVDQSKFTRLHAPSLQWLYYPINTPVCRYQKKLILDSLYNNTLIALPKELDVFFVAAVVIVNFWRWFPKQRVLFICANLESASNAAKRFVEITGHSQDICIYGSLKKSNRYLKLINEGIIFATAESLVGEFKKREELSEISLIVIEDAHRAMAGSHPVCELIRNCIFAKAKFRVLAYTDYKFDKVGQLQLVVMNLQIDLIRSLGSLKKDVSLSLASPRMQKLYIAITEDMRQLGKEILKVAEPFASLLHENGLFPVSDLKKLRNFSITNLQKIIQGKEEHMAEIYGDLINLLSAYDLLMCEGLTAFGNKLQALASRSATILKIIDSNKLLKEACFCPTITRPHNLQCHKLKALIVLLEKVHSHYNNEKSIAVILCRNEDRIFTDGLLATLRIRLGKGFVFFLTENGNKCSPKLTENMMKDGMCNVIIMPCGFNMLQLNVGYVDSLICIDEGLSTLHYTSSIMVGKEGSLYSLCSADYETNIYNFLTAQGTFDCIQPECIKGLQLCNDVPHILPTDLIPEIVEYWPEICDENSGLLSTIERLDFEQRLKFGAPLNMSKLIRINHDLLNICVKETFLWQDRPQRSSFLGHSSTTLKLTNIFGQDPKILEDQIVRSKNKWDSKWLDEDSLSEKTAVTDSGKMNSEVNPNSMASNSNTLLLSKRSTKHLFGKGGTKKKIPRISRVESASFTLLRMLKPQLTSNDFVNHMEEHNDYRKRQRQFIEIIGKLNNLVQL